MEEEWLEGRVRERELFIYMTAVYTDAPKESETGKPCRFLSPKLVLQPPPLPL